MPFQCISLMRTFVSKIKSLVHNTQLKRYIIGYFRKSKISDTTFPTSNLLRTNYSLKYKLTTKIHLIHPN